MNILSENQLASFFENGYLIIPQIIDPETIPIWRNRVSAMFTQAGSAPGDNKTHRHDISRYYSDFKFFLENKEIKKVLHEILLEKPFIACETLVAQQNFYSVWHRDTEYCETLGTDYHLQDDFMMINIVAYLQENQPLYGGGLDVIKGSHKKPLTDNKNGYISLKTKPGDLLIFHQNLLHRASRGRINQMKPKQGIFWGASYENEKVHQFYEIMSRNKALEARDKFMSQLFR